MVYSWDIVAVTQTQGRVMTWRFLKKSTLAYPPVLPFSQRCVMLPVVGLVSYTPPENTGPRSLYRVISSRWYILSRRSDLAPSPKFVVYAFST